MFAWLPMEKSNMWTQIPLILFKNALFVLRLCYAFSSLVEEKKIFVLNMNTSSPKVT